MTVTDEPGYYEDGKFGIRIENVVRVREVKTFGDKGYVGFEHVSIGANEASWSAYKSVAIGVQSIKGQLICYLRKGMVECLSWGIFAESFAAASR